VIPAEIGTYARSQNICPVHLIRAIGAAVSAAQRLPRRALLKQPRAKKLLRKKKNESWAMPRSGDLRSPKSTDGQRPPLHGLTSPTL
jgi:hypothetical protein